MAKNLENLRQVFIVFVEGQCEEYYFDNQQASIGKFMDEGWGHFYQPILERWEFINMQKIRKMYYGEV
ncbi:hypothetical protein CN689_01045 [Peribacillus butanolivorans]|uniref:Uncharacterized protein n=1 Tax=Peribacillus butanolivorans TaxID=421767 RepID=A0AAX0S9R4_9BACI|nr:hypothetical protein [Peribacillus butanolivorans]PEJ37516.1 hypothetical protein CN689_01045 [Peribacillus butanolivorans]